MNINFCNACDTKFVCTSFEALHFTERQAKGPYCDPCWFFVKQLEELQDKVIALEEQLEEKT